MTHPMTPREKVRQAILAHVQGVDSSGRVVARIEGVDESTDAILTALASGSGDQIPGPDDVTAPSQMGFLSALGEAAWEQPPHTGSGDHVNHSGDATDMVDHAELARLAEAATPGPWKYGGFKTGANYYDGVSYESEAEHNGWGWVFFSYDDGKVITEADGRFIAAANPAAVLAILAENAALRKTLEIATDNTCEYFTRATEAERKLAEAVGLLRVTLGDLDRRDVTAETANRIDHFISKEAEGG